MNLLQPLNRSQLILLLHCILNLKVNPLQKGKTHLIIKVDKWYHVRMMRIELRWYSGRNTFIRYTQLSLHEILVITTHIRCLIRSLTCICLFLLNLISLMRFKQLLVWIMWVFLFVGHCIVNIHTFVIKKLGIWYHCSVLEILPKTSSHEMYMNPSNVFWCKCLNFEILRIFFDNTNQLLLLL